MTVKKTNCMAITVDQLTDFGNLDFMAKQAVEGFITGLHKSPFNGFSVEFAEHSQYNPGDSTRHIDWKVYGRTDKLYLKNYEDETNLRCQIVIDNSSSMYYPEDTKAKIKYSCLGAASISYLIQKQRDAVGILAFGTDINLSTPVKSSKLHLHNIFTQLSQVIENEQKFEKTALSKTLHQVAHKMGKRGLVIIFSDLLENESEWNNIFPALQHLKHNKHEIVIFNTFHSALENDFDFDNKPHVFTDIESGQKVKINPIQVKQEYKEKRANMLNDIKLKCAQYKIDLVDADVTQPIELILQSYMIKRSKII